MTKVILENISKTFGKTKALENVSLTVKDGEFFTVLGPSGCGKTTLLRIIAGLEFPDSGRIMFGEEDVTRYKSYQRRAAMVFQNYALWPHMNVFENVAFGLKVRKYPRDKIKEKVMEALRIVKLEGLENRYPNQLSGGQQQRVALARAIVVEPEVLLLDEPLSNLDAKLRVEMREELKRIQRSLGITTIYVTHDQEEALSISDRIAIMNMGRIMQVGTPIEIYKEPSNVFVASFIGSSSVLFGKLKEIKDKFGVVEIDDVKIKGLLIDKNLKPESRVAVVFRSEDFKLNQEENDENAIEGLLDSSMFLGSYFHIRVKIGNQSFLARISPDQNIPLGSRVRLFIKPSLVKIFST